MGYFKDVECIRCGHKLGDGNFYEGCPVCQEAGINVNYTTTFDVSGAKLPVHSKEPGIYKYREFYAIAQDAEPVSIGEGNTPLLKLSRLGEELGIPNLYAKDESRNPTLSFKDRLCSVVATKAKHEKVQAVTISSTGNHGAAMAAYAAAAGLPCVIFTVPQVPETMKTLMQSYGGHVIVVPSAIDRWTIMGQCVKELGWTPVSGFMSPPIGSNCYGIDGYKSIAFEVFQQLEGAPDHFIVPTAYSDGLYGIFKGMNDLKTMGYIDTLPKLSAAEVFGSMEKTLAERAKKPADMESSWSVSFSIAGSTCTVQGLDSVWHSGGFARSSNDEETMAMQLKLASKEGLYAEASSVTSLVAAQKLAKEGKIGRDEKVVVLITSTGLKDPATTKQHLPDPPAIEPDMKQLQAALKNAYGFSI